METGTDLVRIYSGSEIVVNLLKELLENEGISCHIQDDFNASISAGFVFGTPSSVDLFVLENDLDKAKPIVQDFSKTNKA